MSTAAANWPGPQYPKFGYKQTPRESSVRSMTDSGPGIARRRTTGIVYVLSAVYLQRTIAEMDTFRDWYDTTIKGGSLPFNLWNPEAETEDVYRFADVYSVTEVGRGFFEVSVKLQRDPK